MASRLMDVEEIVLSLPPDSPSHLARAAVVCKSWRRIILSDDRDFLSRYRRFHRSPPLLGIIQNLYFQLPLKARFVPTSSTASHVSMPSALELNCYSWYALDCRHGHMLIRMGYARGSTMSRRLIVWDPITGGQQHLTTPGKCNSGSKEAMLCAADGCDHLDCHGGPFMVVFLGTTSAGAGDTLVTSTTTYSSETGVWSALTSIDTNNYIGILPSVLIGDVLYFTIGDGNSILKYDLRMHGLSVISVPRESNDAILMNPPDGGELRLVELLDNCVYMWSQQAGTDDGICGWVKCGVMELDNLLVPKHDISYPCRVVGSIEGTDIIFISICKGILELNLKSRQVRKLGKIEAYHPILPYMSFCTPRFAKGRL